MAGDSLAVGCPAASSTGRVKLAKWVGRFQPSDIVYKLAVAGCEIPFVLEKEHLPAIRREPGAESILQKYAVFHHLFPGRIDTTIISVRATIQVVAIATKPGLGINPRSAYLSNRIAWLSEYQSYPPSVGHQTPKRTVCQTIYPNCVSCIKVISKGKIPTVRRPLYVGGMNILTSLGQINISSPATIWVDQVIEIVITSNCDPLQGRQTFLVVCLIFSNRRRGASVCQTALRLVQYQNNNFFILSLLRLLNHTAKANIHIGMVFGPAAAHHHADRRNWIVVGAPAIHACAPTGWADRIFIG